jgi:trimeric autotransporter adhesin
MTNKQRRHRRYYLLSAILAIFIAIVQSGCGGSSFDQVSGQQGGGVGTFGISAPGAVNNAVTLAIGDSLQFSSGVVAPSVAGQLTLNQSTASANTDGVSSSDSEGETLTVQPTKSDVVDWTSSNPAVATITGSGLLTAVGPGQADVFATVDGLRSGNTIRVSVLGDQVSPTLTSISLVADDNALFEGDMAIFTATGTYSDSSTQDLTSSVTFNSSSPASGLAPDGTGSFTALVAGTTDITASQDGVASNTVTVTVTTPPTLVSISVSPSNPSIEAGGTVTFQATATFSDSSTSNITSTVTWGSTNPSVGAAPGSNGVFSALLVGNTDITASRDGVTSSPSTVNVTSAIVSIAITSNPPPSPPPPPPAPPTSTLFLNSGASATFTATATLADTTTVNVTGLPAWSSSNPAAGAAPSSTGAFTAGTSSTSTNITYSRNGITSNTIAVSVNP